MYNPKFPKFSHSIIMYERLLEISHDSHLQVGMMSSSTSLVHKDHSSWTAVMGWTACALLMVDADASDRPMYLIFPSSTNFFNSPT